jgi:Putative Flp pilus-assembly TadE/G-like
MLNRTARNEGLRERGQVIVLFALLLPVILTIGSVVASVGNWYVLKRHLQTQVDAAALAGGAAFTGCGQDPAATNLKISQEALKYAGDTLRDPTTVNLQLQQAGDQRLVLNSSTYWDESNPTTNGAGYDNTLDSADPDSPPDGSPCNERYLDVKATDDEAPLLFRWIPLFPSLKARAKVEILQVQSTNGVKPLGVPEVDPLWMGVVIVDENGNPNLASSVRGKDLLTAQTTPPTGLEGMSVWLKDGISPVGINGNDNFSVVIVASRNPSASLSPTTLAAICAQVDTHCYAGNALDEGASFIHRYTTSGGGSAGAPIIRDVTLGGGCTDDLSRPYFNAQGGCPIGITAAIDFGPANNANAPNAANHPNPALQGVCAEVSASPGGTLQFVGTSPEGWSLWGNASFTPLAESGANQVNLSWSTDVNGGCNGGNVSGSFPKVAKPYVSNDASGPLQFLQIEKSSGGLANSMAQDSAASLDVVVGLTPPLRDAPLSDPPIRLRFFDVPSQSQALDCINGASGWNEAMMGGCPTYQIYDQVKHTTICGPPPTGVPAADPPDCIESKNGNFQQKGVEDLWPDCATNPNNWDGVHVPADGDPRWVTLFVMDELAFQVSGKKTYPIRRFGSFYVTAASGLNCPGDNPSQNISGKREIWGHFNTYVRPSFGDTIPSDLLCSFTDGGFCTPSLVE